MFKLPELKFDYSELEPYIDAKTVEIHYKKHHKGYATKLFNAIKDYEQLKNMSPAQMLLKFEKVPVEIREQVRNNGGGYINHNLYWDIITNKKTKISDRFQNILVKNFGSLDAFEDKFKDLSKKRFGSGWVFLVVDSNNNLSLTSKPNQDSPIMDKMIPVLGIDLWEHAYYLNYKNDRPAYIDSFWKIINWERVEQLYDGAIS